MRAWILKTIVTTKKGYSKPQASLVEANISTTCTDMSFGEEAHYAGAERGSEHNQQADAIEESSLPLRRITHAPHLGGQVKAKSKKPRIDADRVAMDLRICRR